jgi:hypothetical protein
MGFRGYGEIALSRANPLQTADMLLHMREATGGLAQPDAGTPGWFVIGPCGPLDHRRIIKPRFDGIACSFGPRVGLDEQGSPIKCDS